MGGFHFCHCIRKSPSRLIILLRNSRIIQWYSRGAQKQSLSPRALLQGSIQPWDACGIHHSQRQRWNQNPLSRIPGRGSFCQLLNHMGQPSTASAGRWGQLKTGLKIARLLLRQTWSKQKHSQEGRFKTSQRIHPVTP